MAKKFTPKDYATIFGLTSEAVYSRISKGDIEAVRDGGVWVIPDSVILEHCRHYEENTSRKVKKEYSNDYPLGGSCEPHDIQRDNELMEA